MKLISKVLALTLAVCMVISLAACHPKDEVAFSSGESKITSAMYSACLIQAFSDATEKVAEDTTVQITKQEDYFDQTIDKMPFADWVLKTAKNYANTFVYLDKLEKDGTIALTEDQESEVVSAVTSQWASYSAIYDLNGVSQATYTKFLRYGYLKEQYFESIYGAKGTSPVSQDEQDKYYNTNFVLVHALSDNFTNAQTGAAYTDDEKAAAKTKFENYEKELKKGSRKFDAIYKEFYNVTPEVEQSMKNDKIKDVYAQVIGSKNTGDDYKDDNFAAVQAMKVGETKIINSDSGIILYERLDINSDPYYKTELSASILHLLKDEEFEKTLETKATELGVKENTYATGVFTPKGIKFPEQ
ncbi:MAG: hypothetical protein KBS41_03870 [Oscillospiraceae bacterium]|nr:hypothetical protein [Candidatus Equicaccousia limihippi]